MKPCDAADLDEAALDALLDAELAELASEASSSQPSSPQSLARDSHVIAANTTLGRDDAVDARDDDQGSQGSRDSLAEAWEHLHLGNESRHQNADKFEKDFQELLGLARYKADIDPVVRVVVGELVDAVEDKAVPVEQCKTPIADFVSAVEDPPLPRVKSSRSPSQHIQENNLLSIASPCVEAELEAADRSREHAPPVTKSNNGVLGGTSGSLETAIEPAQSLSKRTDTSNDHDGKGPSSKSDGNGCTPTTSIYSSDAKEAEAKFLASLQAEADAREMERKQMMKEIEEQRKQQRAALEAQWAREDAAIRIQRAARGWNARKAQQQRRAATGLLQRALRGFGAKIRGLRVRQRLRREKEVQIERSFMTAEDQVARSLRAFLWEEQTNMEREDSLARAIRLSESAAQAKARRDMTLEDAYARELRDAEQAMTRREQHAMSAEDVLSQRLHVLIRSEWQAMKSEDDAAQAVRASSRKLLELSAVGNTAYLSGKDLCDLRDAVPSQKCAMLTCIVAERNRFSRFDCVTHRGLASRLSSLQLARNELVSLRGIDVCAQTLEYLDVSGNRLSVAALKPLKSLRNLRVVNLSSNELGHFDGERVINEVAPLERLYLTHCGLTHAPQRLTSSHLRVVDLSENAIEGPALLDSSCMLPELLELKLAGNPLRKLRQRSAHLCPGLQSLDLREVRTSEQDLVEALVEHIHLTGLELGGRALSRSATKYTCRFLRRLKSVNGDTFFRERAFEREIVLLQAAWRGARTRERIRHALDRTQEGYGEEDGDFDLEFASVDMDSFIPQLDEAELSLDPEVSPSASPLFTPGARRMECRAEVEDHPAHLSSYPGTNGNVHMSLQSQTLAPRSNQAEIHYGTGAPLQLHPARPEQANMHYRSNLPLQSQEANTYSTNMHHRHTNMPATFAAWNDRGSVGEESSLGQPNMALGSENHARSPSVQPETHEQEEEEEEEEEEKPMVQSARSSCGTQRNMQNARDREELQSTPDPTRGYQKALRSARSRHAEEEAEEEETMPQRSGRSAGQNAKSRKSKNTKPSRRVGLNFMSVNRRDRQQHMLKRSRKLVPAWARKGQGNE